MAKSRKHKLKSLKSRKSQLKQKRLLRENDRIINKLLSYKSYGLYEIIYLNNGFIQNKELLSPICFEWYKILKKKDDTKTINENFRFEFFTTNSPLYNAISSGFIEIPQPFGNAGKCPVKIKKINKLINSGFITGRIEINTTIKEINTNTLKETVKNKETLKKTVKNKETLKKTVKNKETNKYGFDLEKYGLKIKP